LWQGPILPGQKIVLAAHSLMTQGMSYENQKYLKMSKKNLFLKIAKSFTNDSRKIGHFPV